MVLSVVTTRPTPLTPTCPSFASLRRSWTERFRCTLLSLLSHRPAPASEPKIEESQSLWIFPSSGLWPHELRFPSSLETVPRALGSSSLGGICLQLIRRPLNLISSGCSFLFHDHGESLSHHEFDQPSTRTKEDAQFVWIVGRVGETNRAISIEVSRDVTPRCALRHIEWRP